MDVIQYFDAVMSIIAKEEKLKKTAAGVAKQATCSASGAIVGGVTLGPPGALVGGIVGSAFGYVITDHYPNIFEELKNNLGDDEKSTFALWLMPLAGLAIEEVRVWISKPENKTMIFEKAGNLYKSLNI